MRNLKAVLRSRRPLANVHSLREEDSYNRLRSPFIVFFFAVCVFLCISDIFPTWTPRLSGGLEASRLPWLHLFQKLISFLDPPTNKQCIDFSWWFILTPFLKPGYKAKLTKWWWDQVVKQLSCFRFYYKARKSLLNFCDHSETKPNSLACSDCHKV